MTSQEKLSLIIEGVDKTQDAVNSVQNRLGFLKSTVSQLSISVAALGGAWNTVMGAVQKALAVIDEGAAALRAEEAFKAMADSAEVNAVRLSASMKKAADGMIDDSALMQKAAFAMGQDIDPEKIPQLLEAARVASRKTGKDIAETVDGMVQAIATNMPRSLRQMGAISKEQMNLLNKAAAEGVTEIGLLDLVMANAAVTAAKLGPSANNSAKDIARFKVELKDLKEELGKELLGGLRYLMATFQSVAGFALSLASAMFQVIQRGRELAAIDYEKKGRNDLAAKLRASAAEYALYAKAADDAAYAVYRKAEENFYGPSKGGDTRTSEQKKTEIAEAEQKLSAAVRQVQAEIDRQKAAKKAEQDAEAARKKAEQLQERWKDTARTLQAQIKGDGLDEFEKKLIDIDKDSEKLKEEFKSIPGAAALIDQAAGALKNDAGREAKRKDLEEFRKNLDEQLRGEEELAEKSRQGHDAMAALDRALTESGASELQKRLLAVDDNVQKQRDLAGQAYASGRIDAEAYSEKLNEIDRAAAKEKLRIATETAAQIREAEISGQLSELDIREKTGTPSREILDERIRLTEELRTIQEAYLASLNRQENPTAWYAVETAIQNTRKALADLRREQAQSDPFTAISLGLRDVANDAADTGKKLYDATKKAFDGMTDALTDFVMTGKGSFTDLANSIIRDMIRIQIQQNVTGPLANAIGGINWSSLFGSSGLGGTPAGSYAGFHAGGMGNEPSFFRLVPNMDILPRYHKGLGPGERLSITTDDESTMTPGQRRDFFKMASQYGGGQAAAQAPSEEVHVHLTVNAMDSRSVSQALAQHKDEIVGLVNVAYNKRGQRGPLGR